MWLRQKKTAILTGLSAQAYHSILERELLMRYEFASSYEAELALSEFVQFYNERRLHGGIGNLTPDKKWQEGMALRLAQVLDRTDAAIISLN